MITDDQEARDAQRELEQRRDEQHDTAVAGMKAILTQLLKWRETHTLLTNTSRDGMTVEQHLDLDIKIRRALVQTADLSVQYDKAIDRYTEAFPNA